MVLGNEGRRASCPKVSESHIPRYPLQSFNEGQSPSGSRRFVSDVTTPGRSSIKTDSEHVDQTSKTATSTTAVEITRDLPMLYLRIEIHIPRLQEPQQQALQIHLPWFAFLTKYRFERRTDRRKFCKRPSEDRSRWQIQASYPKLQAPTTPSLVPVPEQTHALKPTPREVDHKAVQTRISEALLPSCPSTCLEASPTVPRLCRTEREKSITHASRGI